MKTYTFTDADGKKKTAKVQDNVFDVLKELDKQERLDDRRETRRCQSLESSMENGFDVIDDTADIDVILDKKERYKALCFALAKLPNAQRELIQKVFFERIPQVEIAKQEGVSHVAIICRLQVILKKLKEILS